MPIAFRVLLKMLAGSLLLGSSAGAPATTGNQTIYFYLDRHDHWCATGNVNHYHRAADAEGAIRLDSDEGLVDYVRGKPVRIETLQGNAEAEVSRSQRYQLNPAGRVISAKFVITTAEDPDAPTRQTYSYLVNNGTYQAQSKRVAAPPKTFGSFRKITSIGSLPVAAVLEQARKQPRAGPFCTKTAAPRG